MILRYYPICGLDTLLGLWAMSQFVSPCFTMFPVAGTAFQKVLITTTPQVYWPPWRRVVPGLPIHQRWVGWSCKNTLLAHRPWLSWLSQVFLRSSWFPLAEVAEPRPQKAARGRGHVGGGWFVYTL